MHFLNIFIRSPKELKSHENRFSLDVVKDEIELAKLSLERDPNADSL